LAAAPAALPGAGAALPAAAVAAELAS
jgi:hypothetical protein